MRSLHLLLSSAVIVLGVVLICIVGIAAPVWSLDEDESMQCSYDRPSTSRRYASPEIFWINMDKSVQRRLSMENHLDRVGWLHRRVKGLSLQDIYIPKGN